MVPIEIHVLGGRQAGRRVVLRKSPVMIGRDPTCDIVIDESAVSRQQVELRFDEEHQQWQAINHSGNGTKMGWSRLRDEPKILKSAAKLAVDGLDLVQATPQPGAVEDDEHVEAAPTEASGWSGRKKLWVSIGAFWAVVFLLALILSTTMSPPEQQDASQVPELSPEQIRQEIYTPPAQRTPDPRRVQGFLETAQEHFALRDSSDEDLYDAYAAYHAALAYTPEQMFDDGVNQRRYQIVQQMLADRVVEQYFEASNLYRSDRFRAATQAFRDLQSFYRADMDSQLRQNIEDYIRASRLQDESR